MKYANYEETNGKLLGWYDKEIHTTIPTPSIEVSDEAWKDALNINANYIDTTTKTLSVKEFRTADELQEAKNNEPRAYLASTDWYVIRELDSGKPMPQDIEIKRQEAREAIK